MKHDFFLFFHCTFLLLPMHPNWSKTWWHCSYNPMKELRSIGLVDCSALSLAWFGTIFQRTWFPKGPLVWMMSQTEAELMLHPNTLLWKELVPSSSNVSNFSAQCSSCCWYLGVALASSMFLSQTLSPLAQLLVDRQNLHRAVDEDMCTAECDLDWGKVRGRQRIPQVHFYWNVEMKR